MTLPYNDNQAKSQKQLLVLVLIIAATIAAYWPVWRFELLNFDDLTMVAKNPHIRNGLTLEGIRWAMGATYFDYWHPMVWFSFMLDISLFGLHPGPLHAVNLLLHIINSLLLYRLLERMTGAWVKCALVAALFALHPLNVESVAWVAERKNTLSTCLGFLTLITYHRYTLQPDFKRYLLMTAMYLLALMAKPMVVTLPMLMLLIDFWPLGRIVPQTAAVKSNSVNPGCWRHVQRFVWQNREVLLEKVPLLVMSVIAVVISLLVAEEKGYLITTESVPNALRWANAVVSYVIYIARLVWPQGLAVFYPFPKTVAVWQVVAAAAALVTLTCVVVRKWRSQPYLFVGWLWFLGALVPVLGLIQIALWPAQADRFVYIPFVGLYIVIVWGGAAIARNCSLPRTLAIGLALAGLLVLGTITQRQNGYWVDTETLFAHAAAVSDRSELVYLKLGESLADTGDLEGALNCYHKALEIDPRMPNAHNMIGIAYYKSGLIEEAITHYRLATGQNPEHTHAVNNFGLALLQAGRIEAAIHQFARVLRIDPEYSQARSNLQRIRFDHRQIEEAIVAMQSAFAFSWQDDTLQNRLRDLNAAKLRVQDTLGGFFRALNRQASQAVLPEIDLPSFKQVQRRYAELRVPLERAALDRLATSEVFFTLACIQARAGQQDRALTRLRQALTAGFDNYRRLAQDTDLMPLRQLPAFRQMLAQLNP